MGFFGKVFNKIKKASRQRLIINDKIKSIQILLDSNDEQYFTLEFDEFKSTQHIDSKVISSYSINASNKKIGNLYIESIQLAFEYDYTQSIDGYFEYMIKRQLNKEKIDFVSTYSTDTFKLSKYTINFEDEIGIIWFNLSGTDLFIVDKKGELFNNLCQYYEIKDKTLIIKNLKNYEFEIKTNILKQDITNNIIGNSI